MSNLFLNGLNPSAHDSEWDFLGKILGSLTGAGGATIPISPVIVTRTITSLGTLSTSGSIASGTKSVQMLFSSDFAGTVAGMVLSGAIDRGYLFPPLGGSDLYNTISYTISAGSITGYKTT